MDDQPGRQTLVDYLLLRTSEAETEQLDERSIADEAFAARLIEVEHDLVDAYVRGELDGTLRERFATVYLATPRGRANVQFAQALQARAARDAVVLAASRNVTARSRIPVWALATAAAVVIGEAYPECVMSTVQSITRQPCKPCCSVSRTICSIAARNSSTLRYT